MADRYADSIAVALRRMHSHSAADHVLALADGNEALAAHNEALRVELDHRTAEWQRERDVNRELRRQRDALERRLAEGART